MGKVSYKSAEDLNKEVWSYPTSDGVRLVARGYNGIGVAILLANRDACDLGKHLIEFAENNLSIDDQPQPRRPDEVGVWEVWNKDDPSKKWKIEVHTQYSSKLYCCPHEGLSKELVDLNLLYSTIVGVRLGDLPSTEPPQAAKPQLIDVAETLMLAVRCLRHEVEWLTERTGADTDRVEHVERIVDQAHDAIAKLREVQ